MDKYGVKCNAKLRLNYFSVNVSVLPVGKISRKIFGFLRFVGDIQQLVPNCSQKNN